ncbi:RNA polymerase sigma factor [Pseudotenacibaculum sp. MALMAid0570]|uniref:RNA polymerase sigma factor n=1 Tax=Pseudotenacibaculum sp. MALMAid0570 TaxID=3143938 RepID=UPI0032DE4348
MSRATDEQIMIEVSKGDLDQLRHLFDRYHLRIYNFFQKMVRNQAVSEDLTQDVFAKVIRYRSSYNQGNFASWIFTIARNIFSTYYQKQKKERSHMINDDMTDSGEILITESNEEELSHLQRALLMLSNSDRELIVMHRFQEIKYSQIAEIMGSSEGAVKVKVHRALKKLKEVYFQTI